ncbi:nucleotide-binding alpha-beta plait domain-containing protein [Tanacetum coccineum]
MAMISAFTTVDKTAHNSRKFAFTLSPTNYDYWKTMIEPFLITNNLMGYANGSIPCTTSRDLWLSLEKAYAPHSTSMECTLKTQLLRIEMHGDETPDAYLNRAQEYADSLAAIGELVKDKDLVMVAVSGLRKEYNGLKTTITACQSPIAFSELHALLSDHDYMLGKTHEPVASITLSFAANYSVGSPSMPEAYQAQLTKLTAQLSALGFQVSPIAPSGPQAFYGVRPSNNNRNNNNNQGFQNHDPGHRIISHLSPLLILLSTSSNGQTISRIDYIDTNTTTTHTTTTTTSHPSLSGNVLATLRSKSHTTGFPYKSFPAQIMISVLPLHPELPRFFRCQQLSWGSSWRQAMKEEYDALMKKWNVVFKYLVLLPTIVVAGNNKGTIENIICQLGSAFALKDLGPHNYFLGIEIFLHVSCILLSQKKYILELLQSDGLSNCNHVSSPMVTSSSLSLDNSTAFSDPVKFRQVVVKRILRYLHGTVKHGMLICRSSRSTLQAFTDVLWKGNPDTSLEAFSDAYWARDSNDRWSTGGFAIYLALLYELGIRSSSTPILWCDNLGATYLSANPVFRARTKHVEIDYHFIREKVAQGDLRV